MARIAGVDIPRDKRVEVSLTYIFGVGPRTARRVLTIASALDVVLFQRAVRAERLPQGLARRQLAGVADA